MTKKEIVFFYRGQIEIGDQRHGYRWVDGYSRQGDGGGIIYPWSSRRVCQHEARLEGARAVFKGRECENQQAHGQIAP